MNINKNTKPADTKPADNKVDEIATIADTPAAVLNLQLSSVTAEQIAASRYSSFKNAELAKACVLVDGVLAKGGALLIDKARIYGRVLSAELWKDDGYTNFKDFAKKVFDDKPGVAYGLAKAGMTFYSANPGTVESRLSVNGWSVLDKLSKLTHEQLDKLDSEKRFPADYRLTQDAADKLAKEVLSKDSKGGKDEDKPVKTFDFSGMIYRGPYFKTSADGTEEYVPAVAEQFKETDCKDVSECIVLTEYESKVFKVGDSVFTVAVDSVGNVQIVLSKAEHKKDSGKVDAGDYNRIRKGYNCGMSADDIIDITGLPADKVRAVFAELDKLNATKDKGKDA